MTKSSEKFIQEALAIEARDAKEAGTLGYMGRALVQATMPHKKILTNEFIRKNGDFTLTMISPSKIGLPYGSIPRLLTAWITTEAVKTKQRELILGRSLSEFMEQLDLVPTGGRWGSITRLREQMKRLFTCSISCTYEGKEHEGGVNIQVAEEYHLWWEPKNPTQSTLWESNIILSKKFFDEVTNHPIPLDMQALKALKKSPMAIDIYCWLTYRMSYLKNKTDITWAVLKSQFGSNYSNDSQGIRNFKKAFIRELAKVVTIYPSLKISYDEKNLMLKPSSTHVPKVDKLVT